MVNVAQIGVGYWGPNLLRNLAANHECTVKVVAELDVERRGYVDETAGNGLGSLGAKLQEALKKKGT